MKFFALHVCFRHAPGEAIDCSVVTANAMQKKLPEVMKDSGTPLKIYISGKGYAFVRFVTLAEALKAIELHHRTYVGKTWITVSPAKESVDRFPVAVVNGNSSVSGANNPPSCNVALTLVLLVGAVHLLSRRTVSPAIS
jgi:RNA recognition motif-containing protein